jgi:predicted O-linked N-acetylglucosamine transferase (SPINDLY family)
MNYGMALRAAERPQEALEMFERALAIQPNLPEALYNRGVALSDLRRYEMAVDAYDRALVIRPEMIGALINRAVALAAMLRLDDAVAGYGRVLAMQPSHVLALVQRGLAFRALRRPEQALADYDRAVSLAPDNADALYNRGVVLMDLERAADALAMFEAVMPAYGNNAEMWNNRGVALWNLKRPAEALASYEQALTLEPGFAEAWGNRGLALRDLGRYEDALASFDQVLMLEPRNAVALNSRANVLRDLKRYEDALVDYDRAAALRSDYAEAVINRGYTKWSLQRYEDGAADVERALALDPNYRYAKGELLHARMYAADWRDFQALKAEVEDGVRQGLRVVQPFIFQAVAENPADTQACSRIWARDKYPEIPGAPHDPAARQARSKIRIGYVSGEFRQQATAILMAGVYDRHDKEAFELVALDAGVDDQSPLRARLEKAFDQWINIRGMSDQQAAEAVRGAGIDILVNLNGFFGDTRMGVFAQRPAPIQVNYLGFPATLGAPYIDYIIGDKTVIPESDRTFYDEQIVYLPGCYQANDDRGRETARAPSRVEAGLPEKGFVFCNFNSGYKLTPETFDFWMRILGQVEDSVLWLLEIAPPYGENLRKEAEARGIAGHRLIFAPVLPTDLHMARLPLADLFLDGLPYNAHTTGSDALWAGVPLVTRTGTTFASRVATSLLTAAGLPELVTQSAAEFEALAVKLAKDPRALGALRNKLTQVKSSALFDTAGFTRHLESAYRTMWHNWLTGEAAKGFMVS